MKVFQEHSVQIKASSASKDVNKKMEVFFNPVMVSNRNISVLLLNSIKNTGMNIALPLAASGIRGLRFLKELNKDKLANLFVNDNKENFTTTFKDNLGLNKIKKKVQVHNQDANLFLLNQVTNKKKPAGFCGYFDYVDLDPFGTPNPFLSSAISRICRKGILAVTATDTSALSGTYEKVTRRKYWATPLRNYMMHEVGLRILIRKVQLLGLQFDKALIPILSYHKHHYIRIYFKTTTSKTECDKILNQHQYLIFNHKKLEYKTSKYEVGVGPLWTGKLFDKKILRKMAKTNPFPEEEKFLQGLYKESKIDMVGFYDLHALAKKYKKEAPKMELVLKKLDAVKTHFSDQGFKTKKKMSEIKKVLR
jgi:tRNA (guanine26-N2/guanine27-N2)-dimethyltransferase